MTIVLLLIIAFLLFILSKMLRDKADQIDHAHSAETAETKPVQEKPQKILSYWEIYKNNNPAHAMELMTVTKGRIASLNDNSVKETISSFELAAQKNMLQSYEDTYNMVLDKMKSFFDMSYPSTIKTVFETIMREEKKQTGRDFQNTMTYYIKAEIDKYIEDKLTAMNPDDLFKYRIKEALQQISEKYEWNYEREGYNSPLAQDAVDLMKSLLDDELQMSIALKFGYAESFKDIIFELFKEFIVEKCNSKLDLALDYHDNKADFDNPRKRCPQCGSANVDLLDPEECEYVCKDCYNSWNVYGNA